MVANLPSIKKNPKIEFFNAEKWKYLKYQTFFFLSAVGSQYYFVLNLTLVIKKFGGNDPLNTKKADC